MFNLKEISIFIGISLILSIALIFPEMLQNFLTVFLMVFIVLLINIVTKKISAFYLDSEIELDIWKFKKYGFSPRKKLKRYLPAGAIFPLIFSLLTLGKFVWLASLVFEVKAKTYRAAKRHGLYSFSGMTEDHIGLIAAAGITANLIFAAIGYLAGFEEFAKLSIYYAFFNILPLSNLDGNKIFFGNLVIWSILATLVVAGVFLSVLII